MTETISDISLYLTVMANGPGNWTPEQVKAAYEFAKTLMPKQGEAEVVNFGQRLRNNLLDKH